MWTGRIQSADGPQYQTARMISSRTGKPRRARTSAWSRTAVSMSCSAVERGEIGIPDRVLALKTGRTGSATGASGTIRGPVYRYLLGKNQGKQIFPSVNFCENAFTAPSGRR